MGKFRDITGQRFGFFTVLELIGKMQGKYIWRCRCDCGTVKDLDRSRLGATKSCGCFRVLRLREAIRTHGQSVNRTPEYNAWANMLSRCKPNSPDYKHYGKNNISVCESWHSFENFFRDMGEKPTPKRNYSIERINVLGNYEPSNCKWATQEEQCQNQRDLQLSKELVLEIRKTFSLGGISKVALAKTYNVSLASVRAALAYRTWKNVE